MLLQGCVNASVPILERRSAGACMVPPITGAMHHSVARTAEDLLVTESCVCGTDYCNLEKPRIAVPEKMKCQAFVRAEVMGTKVFGCIKLVIPNCSDGIPERFVHW